MKPSNVQEFAISEAGELYVISENLTDRFLWKRDGQTNEWLEISSKLQGGAVIEDVDAHPFGTGSIFVNTISVIYRSDDDGNTFAKIYDGDFIEFLQVLPNNWVVIVDGVDDQLYRSTDNGASFQLWPGVANVRDLAQNPTSGKWWAASHDGLYQDQGNGFQLVKPGHFQQVAFNAEGFLYAVGGNSTFPTIFMSPDGDNFTEDFPVAPEHSWNCANIITTEAGLVYLATNKGLFQSNDNETWKQIISGVGNGYRYFNDIKTDRSGFLFAGTSDPNTDNGFLIRSKISTWQPPLFENNLPSLPATPSYGNVIGVIRLEADTLRAFTNHYFLSSVDSGKNWSYTQVNDFKDFEDIAKARNGSLIAVGGSRGGQISKDGGYSWSTKISGGLACVDVGQNGWILAAGEAGFYLSQDDGSSFQKVYDYNNPNGRVASCLVTNDGSLLVGDAYVQSGGELFISEDTGKTWNNLINFYPAWLGLAESPGGIIYAAIDTGLIYSMDGGHTWEPDTNFPGRGYATQAVAVLPDGTVECLSDELRSEYLYRKRKSENWQYHSTQPMNSSYISHDPVGGRLFLGNLWRSRSPDLYIINGREEPAIAPHPRLMPITVHPNPTRGTFRLEGEGLATGDKVTLIDVSGRIIWEKTYRNAAFSVSSLPPGIYFIRYHSPEWGGTTIKLVRY